MITSTTMDKLPAKDTDISKTQLILYLIPIIGFFPSLWTLYQRQGSREQVTASRLSITLAFIWMLGYLLLTTGAVVIGASIILFDPIFQGLAISLVFGAIVSTILTLIVVPLIYYITERKKWEKPTEVIEEETHN